MTDANLETNVRQLDDVDRLDDSIPPDPLFWQALVVAIAAVMALATIGLASCWTVGMVR